MKFPFTLRGNAPFDVAGFGTNAVDHLIRVPAYPVHNTKVAFTSHAIMPGGEVASTLVGLSRLGLRTAYAGRFGDDAAGTIGRDSLLSEAVDIGYSTTVAGAETQIAYIVIDERTGERTIMWRRDAALGFTRADAPLAAAGAAKVLHMTPHDTDAAIGMAEEARRNGVIVSVDIDRRFTGVDELLSATDVCIASEDFFVADYAAADIGALTLAANRYSLPVVGVTLGDRGSLVLCNGELFTTPSFEVLGGCVDTTGAGDAFRAGFLYGLLTGAPVEESCRLANLVASLKCRLPGARAGLPQAEELGSSPGGGTAVDL